jgi:predicted ester cyclase
MSLDANKALIRRAYDELLEQGNFDNIEDIVHSEFVDHTNPPGWDADRGGLLRLCIYFRSAFPDIKVAFDDVVAEGDTVMHRQTMRGTHLGEFFGIPPTGNRVTYTGCHLWRVRDGKVIEHHATNDDLGMLRQLGAIPAKETPADPVQAGTG